MEGGRVELVRCCEAGDIEGTGREESHAGWVMTLQS